MNGASDLYRPRAFSWREAALWGAAALVVAGLYAGAGAWLLGARQQVVMPPAASEAVMVDLAPEPAAPATTEDTPPVDDRNAPEADAVTPQSLDLPDVPSLPPPDFEPAPQTPPEPAPPPLDPAPPPPAQREIADVPVPVARPAPPPRPARREPTPEKHPVERHRPTPPRAAEPRTRSTAAPASAAASPQAISNWQSRLLAHLERRKRYPAAARARREEGTVEVRFRIDGRGNVLSVSTARSSGSANLDSAAVAMVRRASPVPAPPPGAQRTIVAPIRFDLH